MELGGKSPCLVDETADLALAARRIVFGKFLNCGQTCVAPDFIYCDEKRKEALITELKRQITKQFGNEPLKNPAYGKIINKKHFDRIRNLMLPEKVIFGGQSDSDALQIAPTLLDDVTFDDAIMQEEIFGPLLPVVTYRTLEEAVHKINSMDCPLALYLFSQDKSHIQYMTSCCHFGGGCINDTVIHLAHHIWDLAAAARAAWEVTTEKKALIPFPTQRASWIRKPGSIFRYVTSLIRF